MEEKQKLEDNLAEKFAESLAAGDKLDLKSAKELLNMILSSHSTEPKLSRLAHGAAEAEAWNQQAKA